MKKIYSIVFILGIYCQCIAQDLLIYPKRLVFDGTQVRSQNVSLTNNGQEAATYSIAFVDINVTKEGEYKFIETPIDNQQFASPYLRFYPRMVTLRPGETQTVKIQLTKTNELKEGEYRSHLYFRAVPKTEVLAEKEESTKEKNLGIKLTVIYGITIPNIITIGTSTTAVELNDLKLIKENDAPILSVNFNRNGNMSAYGDVQVNHVSPSGNITNVASIKGFAVYSPGNLRKATIQLATDKEVNYAQGKLQVTYSQQDKGEKIAEASLTL